MLTGEGTGKGVIWRQSVIFGVERFAGDFACSGFCFAGCFWSTCKFELSGHAGASCTRQHPCVVVDCPIQEFFLASSCRTCGRRCRLILYCLSLCVSPSGWSDPVIIRIMWGAYHFKEFAWRSHEGFSKGVMCCATLFLRTRAIAKDRRLPTVHSISV